MNKKLTRLALLLFLFAAILTAAYVGYGRLAEQYRPELPAAAEVGPEKPMGEETEAPPENAAEDETDAERAPDFSVTDMEGNSVRLSDHLGRPVVINFWATWCGPCRSELAAYDEACQTYGDRIDFMMIDLTDGFRETEEGVKAFLKENGYSFPVYFDLGTAAANAYGVYSIPLSIFLDAEGKLVAQQIGAMDEKTLQGYLDLLLD